LPAIEEENMKTTLRFLCVALLLTAVPLALAEGEDKQAKKRGKIDARSSATLDEVLGESAKAKELFGKAIGYAIFDNTKVALGLSGGGGSGVAVDKSSGTRTYMKMGTGGVGLGIGVKTYQVIMLFEKEKVFRNFVDNGWQADTQAGAAAGSKGAAVETTFHNGMAVFVRTKKGLMASADVSGTKYWKSDLND
jgi:lipid-binding SYLF domain-containing protein